MAETNKRSPMGRYGARYGRRLRDLAGKIEKEQKKDHKCPYCNDFKVKRKAAGIWFCTKCGAKFSGRAYIPRMEESREKVVAKEVA